MLIYCLCKHIHGVSINALWILSMNVYILRVLMALLILLALFWCFPLKIWAQVFVIGVVLSFSGHLSKRRLDLHRLPSHPVTAAFMALRLSRWAGQGGGHTCQSGSRGKAGICSRSLWPGLVASKDNMAANASDLKSDRRSGKPKASLCQTILTWTFAGLGEA